MALFHGDLRASLLWNPFTVPIVILLATSLGMLFLAAIRGRELVLSKWVGVAWGCVLIGAWLTKLLLGPAHW